MKRWLSLRVEARIALGLATLFVGVLLLLDLWLGVSADRQRSEWELRRSLSENLATTVAQLMQADNGRAPVEAVQGIASRQARVRSVGLRDVAGRWLPLYGDAEAPPAEAAGTAASMELFRIPILNNGAPFGELQVAFHGNGTAGAAALWREPFVRAVVLLGLLGGAAAYLYLRRVLQQIDPQQAIPQRVRAAFDVLDEGVLMLDPQQRVMLVNEGFLRLLPAGTPVALGQPVAQFAPLMQALAASGGELPWLLAQRTLQTSPELMLRLPGAGVADAEREVLAKATPVLDARGRARGTMVSLADVSTLHRLNRQLQASMGELAHSRDELQLRNQELMRLATRDPMTGCLNRRSFFELAERAIAEVRSAAQPMCCVMIDIDHFKRINDSHGHATGDAVIVAVANQLGHTLRKTDLLCRYGGEEFCLLLPNRSLAETQAVAERLRERIVQRAGPAASQASGVALSRVTASLGVAEFTAELSLLPQLIERADMALYVGKRNGRNRVSVWSADSMVAES